MLSHLIVKNVSECYVSVDYSRSLQTLPGCLIYDKSSTCQQVQPLLCVMPWATLATQPASYRLFTFCVQAAQPAFDAIKTSEKAQEPRPTEGREADLTEVAVTQDGSSSTCSDTIIDMAALRVVVDDGGATVAKTAAGGCAVAPVTMPDEVRCAVAPVTMPDEVSCRFCNSAC